MAEKPILIVRNKKLFSLVPGTDMAAYMLRHPDAMLVTKPIPSQRTMYKWSEEGIARATDGCRVEPDGTCPHGHLSWLVVLGLM
jgi:hypothetical protein